MTSKPHPCEECRNTKRRCNGKKPCERCARLQITCQYLDVISPMDEEYVRYARQKEAAAVIDELNEQLDDMERVIQDARFRAQPMKKRQRILYQAVDSLEKQGSFSWDLTVHKGGLRIDTDMKTYSDLINRLQYLLVSPQSHDTLPYTIKANDSQTLSITLMKVLLRKKYVKNRVRGVILSQEMFQTQDATAVTDLPLEKISTTVLMLLHSYIECQHLRDMFIHAPSFLAMCYARDDVTQSPAALALCACMCHGRSPCHHLEAIVPRDQQTYWSELLYQLARSRLEDDFDNPCLETFTALVFLSRYKSQMREPSLSCHYAAMAERMSYLVKPTLADKKGTGESILFERLDRLLRHHRSQFCSNKSDQMRIEKAKSVYPIYDHDAQPFIPAADETDAEKTYLRLHNHQISMEQYIHEAASRMSASQDMIEMTKAAGHRIEMAMRSWYKNLPAVDRLQIPVFEPISENDMLDALQTACQQTALPALTTLWLYDEFMIFGHSLLPKHTNPPWDNFGEQFLSETADSDHHDMQRLRHKWDKRIRKMQKLSSIMGLENSKQEYMRFITSSFKMSCRDIESYKSILTIIPNAIHVLRFLSRYHGGCFFDKFILTDIWRFLVRLGLVASRNSLGKDDLHDIRSCISMCFALARSKVYKDHPQTTEYMAASLEESLNGQTEHAFVSFLLC